MRTAGTRTAGTRTARALHPIWFVLVLLSLTGCELLLVDAAMDFTLSLEPAEVTVARGTEREITVKASRTLPVSVAPTPIAVTLYDPPPGVALKEAQVDIPSGIDARILTIQVSGGAEPGSYDVTVEGTTGLKTKQTTLALTVE